MARRNPEETRQRILQAATDLFYARGIRAVGVDAIAAEAGVTKRTMYKHFESKDALIVCYLEARDEPVLTGLINSIANAPGDIADRIASMFIALAKRAEGKSWQGCPFARAVSELRDADTGDVAKIAGDHKHTFEHWLEMHLAADSVESADLVARQVMVLLDGCITQLLIHRDSSYAYASAKAARCLIRARCP
ncbi:MAG: TetR family transcriptional regulator [Alphaproteobacteria bacterium]|nr:TetR family transcriptional regulator [Alphaproteobacteria bacterium]